MGKKKISARRKRGCPPKEIDWEYVDSCLISQCPATDIASDLGICVDTLYIRCKTDKGIDFSAYRQSKQKKGLCVLRRAQFRRAVSDKGNSEMLKWLGAEYLNQGKKDNFSNESLSDLVEKAQAGKFDDLLRQPDV
jgi:hypothetical protein